MRMRAIHRLLRSGDEQFTAAELRGYDATPQEHLRPVALVARRPRPVAQRGGLRRDRRCAAREPADPAAARHALSALALVPGVQLLGNVHDRLGRAAIGVAFTEHTGMRQELLFDPRTAEILNEREVVAHRGAGDPRRGRDGVEVVVYTRRAVTDSTARP